MTKSKKQTKRKITAPAAKRPPAPLPTPQRPAVPPKTQPKPQKAKKNPPKKQKPAKKVPAPRKKKIQKVSAEEKQRIKAEERQRNNQGKLLDQLRLIEQRIQMMDQDNERYCLVGMAEDKKGTTFTILKDQDPKKVTIKVAKNNRMSCSCMDWRIRCQKMSIPCKHIYYLLTKILTYELFDFFDNTILNIDLFKDLVKRRIRLNVSDYKVKEGEKFEGEMCPICYREFAAKEEQLLAKCPDCKYFLHKECMKIWLKNSKRRNCVVCRSESWVTFFPQLA